MLQPDHMTPANRAPTNTPKLAVATAIAAIVTIAACGSSAPKRPTLVTEPPTPPRQAKWGLEWSDDFDGPTLNAANWIVSDGPVDVNSELEYYSPSAVTI